MSARSDDGAESAVNRQAGPTQQLLDSFHTNRPTQVGRLESANFYWPPQVLVRHRKLRFPVTTASGTPDDMPRRGMIHATAVTQLKQGVNESGLWLHAPCEFDNDSEEVPTRIRAN